MKPLFALTLEDDSVGLLHRRPDGWSHLGTVRFDAPDMAEALVALREHAASQEPGGLAAKLLLPASQILYSKVYAPGPGKAVQRAQIAAALEGQTPYSIDELAFDWSGEGDHVDVAVVALETLDVAERFAVENGFNPVTFVTLPPEGAFPREPWFGITDFAREEGLTLADIERDTEITRILPPEPEPEIEVLPEVKQEAEAEAEAIAPSELLEEAADVQAEVVSDTKVEEAVEPEAPAVEAEVEDTALPPMPVALLEDEDEANKPAAPIEPPTKTALKRLANPQLLLDENDPLYDDAPFQSEFLIKRALERSKTPPAIPVPSMVPADPPRPAGYIDDLTPSWQIGHDDEKEDDIDFAAILAAKGQAEMPKAEPEAIAAAEIVPEIEPELEPVTEAAAEAEAEAEAVAESDVPSQDEALVAPEEGADLAPIDTSAEDLAVEVVVVEDLPADDLPTASEIQLDLVAERPAFDPPPERTQLRARATEPQPMAAPKAPAPQQPMAASLAAASPLEEELDGEQTVSWPGEDDNDPLAAAKAALAASLSPQGAATAGPRLEPTAPIAGPRLSSGTDQPEGSAAPKLAAPTPSPARTSPKTKVAPKPPTEADELTVFGKRKDQQVRGKPRYLGLILVILLLAAMAAVAIWASTPSAEDSAEQSTLSLPVLPDLSQADLDEEEADSALADANMQTEEVPAKGASQTSVEPEPAVTELEAQLAQPAPELTSPPPQADAPTEGPQVQIGAVDQLTLPKTDTPPALPPVVSIASVSTSNSDAAPRTPAALPAFGALYQFDAQGNILPTPEGVVTPDGITLIAARPSNLPPARPEGWAPAAAQPSLEAAPPAATPGAIPLEGAAAAPEQAAPQPEAQIEGPKLRPRQRPEALTPADQSQAKPAEAPIEAQAGLPTGASLLRPQTRPASIAAAAATASLASTVALNPAEASLPPTRRPPARPASIAAQASAAKAASTASVAAAAAAAAETAQRSASLNARLNTQPPVDTRPNARNNRSPEVEDFDDDGEPETARAAPAIPTRASVAKQATVVRGIKLNALNLIGVFGTSNSRYALVRNSNGRVSQVRIGDSIDGGQVVAIGQSELSYRKRGGQTVKLQMPRS